MVKTQYLLDTNICVFFLRGKYDIGSHLRNAGIENCHISEITYAELLYGAECSFEPEKNKELVSQFCKSLHILPISSCIGVYAQKKSELRKKGLMIDDFDLLIGCTAIKHAYTLVTDNTKHFDRLTPQLENWITR